MKMKLLTAAVAATGFVAAPIALSATYQSEISAAYVDVDEGYSSGDGHFVGAEGIYYFSAVDTKNHPLAEAAFIEKSSNVYLTYSNAEFKAAGERTDIDQYSLGVDFFIPNTMFYLGAGVNRGKAEISWQGGIFSSGWDSSWFVKAGITPVTGLLVWTEFTEDVDVSDQWNINGKYVIPLSGEQALNIEASYAKSDIDFAEQTINGAVDYYIDRHLSIGGGFVNMSYSGDESSTTDYFVRARNFFTDKISADLTYTDGDYESSVALGGTIRF